MSEPIISLTEVKFRWHNKSKYVLDIPKLAISKGENIFIKGASGIGKSTLLNLIIGINEPTSGTIRVLGADLNNLSAGKRDEFRVNHFGIIFQQFNLLPYLTILENIALPCWFSNTRNKKVKDVNDKALRLLGRLKIPSSMFDKPVNTLSVGQQQRVAVARALIGKPDIIIADEPTSALDNDNCDHFLDLLFSEISPQGSTLVYVSHDEKISTRFENQIDLSEVNQAKVSSEYAT